MPDDPLDTVLRLVAEGRLTADEAGPILTALDARAGARPGPEAAPGEPTGAAGGPDGRSDHASANASGRSLRIEVRDEGRTVVNLRLPLALGSYALDRVPGLSGDQVDRVRAALRSGMTGPVLVVDDENGGVRISID